MEEDGYEDDDEYMHGPASLGLASGCRGYPSVYRGERGSVMHEKGLLDAQVQSRDSGGMNGDLD